MSYQRISLGSALLLRLQTGDASASKFPLAYVYDSSHAAVAGSPFSLTHLANGLYVSEAFTPASADHFDAVYKVFTDAGHTTLDPVYNVVTDSFDVYTLGTGGDGGTAPSQLTVVLSSEDMAAVMSSNSLSFLVSSQSVSASLESSSITAVVGSESLSLDLSSDVLGAELSSDSLDAELSGAEISADLQTEVLTATFTCSP